MEVDGEAVVRVDCSNTSSLADAIAQVLTDQALRERLIRLGRAQAEPFTKSEVCASATRRAYEEALGIDKPATPPIAPSRSS